MALSRVAVAACATAFLVVACHDMSTDPPLDPSTPTVGERPLDGFSAGLLDADRSPFTCFTSRAVSDGPWKYKYGRLRLPVPAHVVQQAQGETATLRYRLYRSDGSLVRLANCTIPRTQAAIDWAMEYFDPHGRTTWKGPLPRIGDPAGLGSMGTMSGSVGTMGEDEETCGTEENPCTLRGVVADCSNDNPECTDGDEDDWEWEDEEDGCGDDWGDDGYCDGDGSGGDEPCDDCEWSGGGDDDENNDDEEEELEPCDDIGDDDSSTELCNLSQSKLDEVDNAIRNEVTKDSTWTSAVDSTTKSCSDLHSALSSYYSSNRIIGHTTNLGDAGGYFHSANDTTQHQISLHPEYGFEPSHWLIYVLAHEAGHHLEYMRAYEEALAEGKTTTEAIMAGRAAAAEEPPAREWACQCTGYNQFSWDTGERDGCP